MLYIVTYFTQVFGQESGKGTCYAISQVTRVHNIVLLSLDSDYRIHGIIGESNIWQFAQVTLVVV